jgi:hypothetical protein
MVEGALTYVVRESDRALHRDDGGARDRRGVQRGLQLIARDRSNQKGPGA